MSTVWIRVTFGAVVAMLVAFTVIFGITMVTPGPKPPSDPGITFSKLSSGDDSSARSQNQLTQQIDNFYGKASEFRDKFPGWQRNVFIAATGFGVLVVLIGLALPAAVNYLRWGLVLGGGMLLVYGFVISAQSPPRVAPEGSSLLALLGAGEPDQLDFAGRFARFAVSFIGLILALFLGLWRLTEWPSQRRPVAMAAQPVPAPPPAVASQWAPPSPPPAPVSTPPSLEYAPARAAPESAPKSDEPTPEWRRPD
jgi:hypothetical protein